MSSLIKQSFALLILTTLALVSIFGVCKGMASMNSAGHEGLLPMASMQECNQEAGYCVDTNSTDHMAIFNDVFPIVLVTGLALIIIQGYVLLASKRTTSETLQLENIRQRLKFRFGPERWSFIAPDLQFAFSQGILHPKKDA